MRPLHYPPSPPPRGPCVTARGSARRVCGRASSVVWDSPFVLSPLAWPDVVHVISTCPRDDQDKTEKVSHAGRVTPPAASGRRRFHRRVDKSCFLGGIASEAITAVAGVSRSDADKTHEPSLQRARCVSKNRPGMASQPGASRLARTARASRANRSLRKSRTAAKHCVVGGGRLNPPCSNMLRVPGCRQKGQPGGLSSDRRWLWPLQSAVFSCAVRCPEKISVSAWSFGACVVALPYRYFPMVRRAGQRWWLWHGVLGMSWRRRGWGWRFQ